MTKCNKRYIVVKSQCVLHILQFIAIWFWHIVTAVIHVLLLRTVQLNFMWACYSGSKIFISSTKLFAKSEFLFFDKKMTVFVNGNQS